MNASPLLISLFRYKAWAGEGLIAGLSELGEKQPCAAYDAAISILHHAHVVDRIFVAHLQRTRHAYATTDADESVKSEDLFEAIKQSDQWYIGYVTRLGAAELAEVMDFIFSDGTPGRMSREEMLAHVITHGGYHRGEIGRIITQLTASSPRDTFTGYLHEVEPARGNRV